MKDNSIETAEFFKALGDPTRIKLLKLLLTHKNLCVGIIAKKLEVTQPAVSQHLKNLKSKGIVDSKRMGFHIHYHINKDIFEKFGVIIDKAIKIPAVKCELEEHCKKSQNII